MNKKFGLRRLAGITSSPTRLTVAAVVVVVAGLMVAGLAIAGAVSTTDNPGYVGPGTYTNQAALNGNGVNGNIYSDKRDVWLSGLPNGATPDDGTYFFAVLVPGGQPTPNDATTVPDATSATPKNLSDDVDAYTNRTFTISGGLISAYSGTHLTDGTAIDGYKIQLFDYANTTNPGGVYILAVCSLGSDGTAYPVSPNNCKYDAFKVLAETPPPNQVASCFSGTKYRDDNKNGQLDGTEVGLQGWVITLDPGTPGNTADDLTATTDADGNWSVCEPAHDPGSAGSTTTYTVSETLQAGWRQTGNTVDQTIALGGASVTLSYPGTATPPYTYAVTVPNDAIASADGLNFGNIPQGTITGAKYYDSPARTVGILDLSGSGPFSALDALISGWKINQGGDASASITTGASGVDANGYPDNFTRTLDPGTYTFAEVQPTNAWIQTGNTSKQGTTTGGATVTLTNKSYSVTIPNDQPSSASGIYFGNVCLAGGGGLTLGFWSNSNGKALFGADDLALMVSLNLRNANGTNFDPANYAAFRTWILNATATNMAYMLSAQLAAMELNVLNNKVSGSALIYAPGTLSADSNGFATVNAVMAEANTELGLHGLTVTASATRTYQEALKNALDKANNNLNFVQSSGSTCPAPTFPAS